MNFSLIIDAVIILFGSYFIYITAGMKKKMEIPSALLAEEERNKVKDVSGFIGYLFIPMIFCAICFVILGIFNLLLDLKVFSFPYDNYISLSLFLIVFGFYLVKFRNAKKTYCK